MSCSKLLLHFIHSFNLLRHIFFICFHVQHALQLPHSLTLSFKFNQSMCVQLNFSLKSLPKFWTQKEEEEKGKKIWLPYTRRVRWVDEKFISEEKKTRNKIFPKFLSSNRNWNSTLKSRGKKSKQNVKIYSHNGTALVYINRRFIDLQCRLCEFL